MAKLSRAWHTHIFPSSTVFVGACTTTMPPKVSLQRGSRRGGWTTRPSRPAVARLPPNLPVNNKAQESLQGGPLARPRSVSPLHESFRDFAAFHQQLALAEFSDRGYSKPLSLANALARALKNPTPPTDQTLPLIKPEHVLAALYTLVPQQVPIMRPNAPISQSTANAALHAVRIVVKCVRSMRARQHIPQSRGDAPLGSLGGDLVEWDRVMQHPVFLQARLVAMVHIFSKPVLRDVKVALQMFDIRNDNPPQLSSYNILLHLVSKRLELPYELGSQNAVVKQHRLPLGRMHLHWEEMEDRHFETASIPTKRDAPMTPQSDVIAFSEVWRHLCAKDFRPNYMSYGSAVMLETKLALWRVTRSDKPDDLRTAWRPVQNTLDLIQRREQLHISHLNQVLWSGFRYIEEKRKHKWHSVESIIEAYRWLRDPALCQEGSNAVENSSDSSNRSTAGSDFFGLQKTDVRPNAVTYELMIRGLCHHGDLMNALIVFKDMISHVSVSHSGIPKELDDRSQRPSTSQDAQEDHKQLQPLHPSISTYVTLFYGFAKHGTPSQLVEGNPSRPRECQWKPLETAEGPWKIDVLVDVLEGFLSASPNPGRAEVPIDDSRVEKDTNFILDAPLKILKYFDPTINPYPPSFRVRPELKRNNWRVHPDRVEFARVWPKQKRVLPLEALSSEKAPSPNQLFQIVTALRRVSNDHVPWVLAQWDRIEAKFGPSPSGIGERPHDKDDDPINRSGWAGWKLDKRMERLIDWLRAGKPNEDMHKEFAEMSDQKYPARFPPPSSPRV